MKSENGNPGVLNQWGDVAMGKKLVIVESPSKAKTINKILGKDYIVKSSFGHIRDLKKKDFGNQAGIVVETVISILFKSME